MQLIPQIFSDHIIRGTSVLPGTWFVELASSSQPHLTDIKFHRMLDLSDSETHAVELRNDHESMSLQNGHQLLVSANIASVAADELVRPAETRAGISVSGTDLYRQLFQQGNEYGEAFQGITRVELPSEGAVPIAVGHLNMPPTSRGDKGVMTVVLDSCTHVIACLAGVTSTYFLESIARSSVFSEDLRGELTVDVALLSQDENGCVADCEVLSAHGKRLLAMRGVKLALIDNIGQRSAVVAVASNFTIDPLAVVSDYWSNTIQLPVRFDFADYDQVHQTLLSSESVFSASSHANVCLLRVADWAMMAGERQKNSTVLEDKTGHPVSVDSNSLANGSGSVDHDVYALPDGREVASLNRYETAYLYQEIFNDLVYRRYGVTMLDNDVVIDIGANIGLFTLFAVGEAENVRSIAIEPSPIVLPLLKANLRKFAPGSTVIAAGASDKKGTATFTAYRNSSVFSSFNADTEADEGAIRAVIKNTLEAMGDQDDESLDAAVEQLLQGRTQSESYECELVRVSDVIRDNNLTHIGLLKIDAEKSEDAIMSGIDDEHWKIIDQVILEVHLQGGRSEHAVVEKLQAHGFEITRDEEDLLGESGLISLYAIKPGRLQRNRKRSPYSRLEDNAKLFVESVKSRYMPEKFLDIVLCPADIRDPQLLDKIKTTEKEIIQSLSELPQVRVRELDALVARYPIQHIHESVGHKLANIPYTGEWYGGVGTALAREALARRSLPYKVIVCDCDNTLWQGVVGEDGVEGIHFNESNLALHVFIRNKIEEGFVFCLASKNSEADVRAVFDSRSELSLSWSDVVAARVNWQSKALNIAEIAQELNLGLDSFVFIDDSDLELGEMRNAHPEILTIKMPENNAALFFNHLWPLDSRAVTDEDRKRAARYQQERKRQDVLSTTTSVEEFVKNLELKVNITSVTDSSIDRASQMTLRTNQFNLSTIRRDNSQISSLMAAGSTCETISVEDRFGDYGITGLIIYAVDADVLIVDTLLLSCRVLGRGVEHEVVRHLGQIALQAGVNQIKLDYRKTPKNEPAKRFLDTLSGERSAHPDGFELIVAADTASVCSYGQSAVVATDEIAADMAEPVAEVDSATEKASAIAADDNSQQNGQRLVPDNTISNAGSERWQSIASTLNSAVAVDHAVSSKARLPRPQLQSAYQPAKNEIETNFLSVWEYILGLDGIGMLDNFFELGGTSLKGIQMAAEVRRRFGYTVAVTDVFDNPTIARLAQLAQGGKSADSAEKGRARGAARRSQRPAPRARGRG